MAWKPAQYCQPVWLQGWRWLLCTNRLSLTVLTLTWHTNNNKKSVSTQNGGGKKTQDTPQKIWSVSAAAWDGILTWKWITLLNHDPCSVCVCVFKGCLALRHTHLHKWKGGEESEEESRWQRTHHFLVVWVVNLFNQWELLWAQLLVESRHLSKLK